jgi:hypothetical protein
MSNTIASDSTAPEVERATAQIIAFPGRPKPAAVRVGVPAPHERLARALESLNAALTEQRAAMAAWRGALGELRATTAGLRGSLQTYQSNLNALSGGLSSLRAKARSLEQWADATTSAPSGSAATNAPGGSATRN